MEEMLELEIRRGHAYILPKLSGLCLWIKSAFGEICYHDNFVHEFQVRQKAIDSLLRKIDGREDIFCFEDVTNNINDLVGARLIVYMPNRIKDIHRQILNSDSMHILQIKIHHYKRGDFENLISSISADATERGLIFQEQSNESGYFGVHYIIKPQKKLQGIEIHEKFELQVRTLMNHAWSEVQHKAIYKSPGVIPDPAAKTRFADLAQLVYFCDSRLEDLVQSVLATPSVELTKEQKRKIIDKFKPLHNKINKLIEKYEQHKISSSDFQFEAETIFDEYSEDIQELSQNISNKKYIYSNLSLAELYLKTIKFDKAYEIYSQCREIKNLPTDIRVKILLRIGETFEEQGNIEDAEHSMQELEDILSDYNSKAKAKDHLLYQGIAMLAWRLDKYQAALNLGHKALKLYKEYYAKSNDKKSNKDILLLKYILNVIYYHLDLWHSQNETSNNEEPSPSDLENLLDELQPQVDEAIELLGKNVEANASNYDTIAWYFYYASKAYYVSGDIDEAKKTISRATDSYEKCIARWSRCEISREPTPRELWIKHGKKIDTLAREIDHK